MTDTDSGVEWIREALRARNSKLNLSVFGRELGCNADQLHNFIFNGSNLTPDKVHAICDYLWAGNTIWDEKTDKLMPRNRAPAISQGIMPEFNIALPKWNAGPCQSSVQPAKDSPTPIKPKQRPGWLTGWW